jgi:hypothetical protein
MDPQEFIDANFLCLPARPVPAEPGG